MEALANADDNGALSIVFANDAGRPPTSSSNMDSTNRQTHRSDKFVDSFFAGSQTRNEKHIIYIYIHMYAPKRLI